MRLLSASVMAWLEACLFDPDAPRINAPPAHARRHARLPTAPRSTRGARVTLTSSAETLWSLPPGRTRKTHRSSRGPGPRRAQRDLSRRESLTIDARWRSWTAGARAREARSPRACRAPCSAVAQARVLEPASARGGRLGFMHWISRAQRTMRATSSPLRREGRAGSLHGDSPRSSVGHRHPDVARHPIALGELPKRTVGRAYFDLLQAMMISFFSGGSVGERRCVARRDPCDQRLPGH
jgi:hypothetical protein